VQLTCLFQEVESVINFISNRQQVITTKCVSLKATVTEKGAILLGRHVACDAHEEGKPIRVVTHIHADHLLGLRQSLKKCETVVMTSITKDLIDVMKGPLFLMAGNVKGLNYKEELWYGDEKVTLYPADHIWGAAQVLVEDANQTRIVYTGDFRLPETPVIKCDILVMEATYGNPNRVRSFGDQVEDILVSLVEESLKNGLVYLFGYYGKLQEVMQILHKAKVKVPFVVPEKIFHVSKICERHGMRFGRRLLLSSDAEAELMLQRNEPCVAFYHMGSRRRVGDGALRIYLSGWEFGSPCRQIGEKEYRIALSDHCDFNGLLRYVRESEPKMVITDNYRAGDAYCLAREIRTRLGIPAEPVPH